MPNENAQVEMLKQQLESLQAEYYRNNFIGSQYFNKNVRFNVKVRLPVYATAPAKCELGEVYVNSGTGKAYVCSSANTWALIGTQA